MKPGESLSSSCAVLLSFVHVCGPPYCAGVVDREEVFSAGVRESTLSEKRRGLRPYFFLAAWRIASTLLNEKKCPLGMSAPKMNSGAASSSPEAEVLESGLGGIGR